MVEWNSRERVRESPNFAKKDVDLIRTPKIRIDIAIDIRDNLDIDINININIDIDINNTINNDFNKGCQIWNRC
jgi:hypothetical protein